MSTVGIVPARLHSTRLPQKLLLEKTGKPLLWYAWEAATRAKRLDAVLIATDSGEIFEKAKSFGARCVLTGEHPSGTDRIAEVVARDLPDSDLIVNIQGDEPELDPSQIDLLVSAMQERPQFDMGTLATPMTSPTQILSSSAVKVVCRADGEALYFSRSVIPHCRDTTVEAVINRTMPSSPRNLHIGIYAYRREALLRLASLKPSLLESLEKLEQLRALECGMRIHVSFVPNHQPGIDTPEDYAAFAERERIRQKA